MSDAATPKGLCSGCGVMFTPTGLGFHLSQTTNPACRKVYLAQREYVPQLHVNPAGPMVWPPSPLIAGQNFPDGLADGFAAPDSDDEIPLLVHSDDSDDEDEPATGWERHVEPEPDVRIDSPADEPGPLPQEAEHQARETLVEERFTLTPHITTFSRRAGEPIRTETPAYPEYYSKQSCLFKIVGTALAVEPEDQA
ncbi:hypothetical protein B0H14DRAFT_2590462 [Mycena olivaceomarginata]|nr:hypothetical protein B0H14DRAFT_2590462 [Mycena olivaceomarginata]